MTLNIFLPYTYRMSVTVIGTIYTDIKGYPTGSFIPNGRNAGVIKTIHGGGARNAAEDLARLGIPTDLVALKDRSETASEVIKRLEKSGVNTRFVFGSDAGMGTWMAIFDEKGDVAANISVRPDLSPLTALIEEHREEIFSNSDGIIFEIDIEPETVEKVFEYAAKYGVKVYALISNMSIAKERRGFFSKTECFICNLQEAGMLFCEDFSALSVTETEKRIAALAPNEGFSKLIVTLGEKGALYFDCCVKEADGFASSGYCPAKKVKVTDTTGAGDAFCAGASASLINGMSLPEACRNGSLLAASVIQSTENVLMTGDYGSCFAAE